MTIIETNANTRTVQLRVDANGKSWPHAMSLALAHALSPVLIPIGLVASKLAGRAVLFLVQDDTGFHVVQWERR